MTTGVLNVTVIKATNVQDSDFFFSDDSDPYVVVQCLGQSLTTFVANVNGKGEAIWDERLTFKVDDVHEDFIQFQIFDKDRFSDDDLVMSIREKLNMEIAEESMILKEIYAENCAKLYVTIHYMPFTMMEKMYQKLSNKAEEMKKKLISQIITFVTEKVI